MKPKKILGIDYGDFTIGLAIFDLKMDFIYPYKTIKRKKASAIRESVRNIIEIVKSESIDEIVVGLPLNFDGTSGERVEKVKIFIEMLKIKLIPVFKIDKKDDADKIKEIINSKVHLQDERLTTKEASEILLERGIKKSEQKKVIDQVAATIILSDYRQSILTQ